MLYISPPMEKTASNIKGALNRASMEMTSVDGQTFAIPFGKENAQSLCTALQNGLSTMELQDTKSLFLAETERFGVEMLSKVIPLGQFLSIFDNKWLVTLLEERRLETWFQPIVHSNQPESIFAYECLMRGKRRNGDTVFPGELFGTARSSNLIFYLDRLCRQTAIKDASRHNIDAKLFINFNPTTIYDPVHCLQTTLETIKKYQIPFNQVVFEVVETDNIQDINHLLTIVSYYRKMGFSLALDDLGAGYSSLNLLHQIEPDYIKIDLELIRDVHKNRSKGVIVKNLLAIANSLGIQSIAEGVEQTEEWHWLKAHGADYIQGYLFAKPAAIPPLPKIPF